MRTNHITQSQGDFVCVTEFRHGRHHTSEGMMVHHTDMSHQMDDGTVYGERDSTTWLTPEMIAIRGAHCLRRHLKLSTCAE